VLVVFRSKSDGAANNSAELSLQSRRVVGAAAPNLAERIEQALGFYQRLHPFEEEAED
jgi:hypothetical protein